MPPNIDSSENAARLTGLLTALGDPVLDADLAIFNQNALEAAVDTVVGGVTSAAESFSPAALIMGLLHPVIQPLDTLLGLCLQVLDFVKDPSLDRLLTFLRDVTGTLALYLGLLSGACWAASAAMALAGLPPVVVGGVSLAAISASISGVALAVGVFSLVLAALKLVVDVAEGAGASTAGKREHEEREVGQDVTLLGIAGLFAGMIRGMQAFFERLRGPATVKEKADPKTLEQNADEAKQVEGDAKQSADEAKQKGDDPAGGRPMPAPGTTARRRLSLADIRRMREQRIKVLTFRSGDPNVVANLEITAQHRTNPNLPDDRIHFVEGYEGANYGRYSTIIEFDKVWRPNLRATKSIISASLAPTSDPPASDESAASPRADHSKGARSAVRGEGGYRPVAAPRGREHLLPVSALSIASELTVAGAARAVAGESPRLPALALTAAR
jgi:hypothetical protein